MTRKERTKAKKRMIIYNWLLGLFMLSFFVNLVIIIMSAPEMETNVNIPDHLKVYFGAWIFISIFLGCMFGYFGSINGTKLNKFRNNVQLWRQKHHAKLMYGYVEKQDVKMIFWMFNNVIAKDRLYSDHFFLLSAYVLKYSSSEEYGEIGVKSVNSIKNDLFNPDKVKF